ncbi:MAG: ParB/RepB/Spo0J family partition protein [Pirellulales bacterium]|nr:ParB/RepB/Spo0J family partition protein [Pirellulales bacterium]
MTGIAEKMEIAEQIEMVPLDTIDYPVSNHRQTMDPAKLEELSNSIATLGVQQPIKVCFRNGRYAMIFGHRRVKASEKAGRTDIPAIVVEDWTNEQIAEAQVIENILREDLNPIEEARCVQTLVEGSMFPIDVAASKMGKSVAWARQRLDLLRLDEKVADLVAMGRLPLGHALLLARLGDHKDQVDMAARAIGFFGKEFWNDKTWDNAIKGDYLMPLNDIRKEIKYKLCKMGSAHWPQDVEYAKRRPCLGCPDNTETEPGLFDALNIERTSKRGNCTNPACFQAKAKAWEKDPVKKQRDKAREEQKKAKAKDAEQDEPKAGSANESYEQREKRIAKLRKQFPWNDEQMYAVELFRYANRIAQAIGGHVTMKFDKAEECCQIEMLETFLVLFLHNGDGYDCRDLPTLTDWLGGKKIPGTVLGKMITEAAALDAHTGPRIGYSGDVENVPLDEGMMKHIESLEELASRWGVDFSNYSKKPSRPTMEDILRKLIVGDILKAAKDDALKLIAACVDGVALADMVKDAKTLKLPKYKLKAIGERITTLSLREDAPNDTPANPACIICGGTEDVERDVCMSCIELIQHGPKKKQKDVLAAIAKAPVELLTELQDEGLRGDWRRQAVAKRIKEAGA